MHNLQLCSITQCALYILAVVIYGWFVGASDCLAADVLDPAWRRPRAKRSGTISSARRRRARMDRDRGVLRSVARQGREAGASRVWRLSRQSAGLCARFVTDASAISGRWALTCPAGDEPHAGDGRQRARPVRAEQQALGERGRAERLVERARGGRGELQRRAGERDRAAVDVAFRALRSTLRIGTRVPPTSAVSSGVSSMPISKSVSSTRRRALGERDAAAVGDRARERLRVDAAAGDRERERVRADRRGGDPEALQRARRRPRRA